MIAIHRVTQISAAVSDFSHVKSWCEITFEDDRNLVTLTIYSPHEALILALAEALNGLPKPEPLEEPLEPEEPYL